MCHKSQITNDAGQGKLTVSLAGRSAAMAGSALTTGGWRLRRPGVTASRRPPTGSRRATRLGAPPGGRGRPMQRAWRHTPRRPLAPPRPRRARPHHQTYGHDTPSASRSRTQSSGKTAPGRLAGGVEQRAERFDEVVDVEPLGLGLPQQERGQMCEPSTSSAPAPSRPRKHRRRNGQGEQAPAMSSTTSSPPSRPATSPRPSSSGELATMGGPRIEEPDAALKSLRSGRFGRVVGPAIQTSGGVNSAEEIEKSTCHLVGQPGGTRTCLGHRR